MISSRNNYMLNKRKAQGLSITTIIVAVIALIVLVVIVAILTGKLGGFSAGVEGVVSCENTCKALGMKAKTTYTKASCVADADGDGYRYMSGTYSDVSPPRACCCIP